MDGSGGEGKGRERIAEVTTLGREERADLEEPTVDLKTFGGGGQHRVGRETRHRMDGYLKKCAVP